MGAGRASEADLEMMLAHVAALLQSRTVRQLAESQALKTTHAAVAPVAG